VNPRISDPDRRVDLLYIAASDLAGENALAGVMSDIGIDHYDTRTSMTRCANGLLRLALLHRA